MSQGLYLCTQTITTIQMIYQKEEKKISFYFIFWIEQMIDDESNYMWGRLRGYVILLPGPWFALNQELM